MSKNAVFVFVLSGVLILGLLIWNIYLVNQVGILQKSKEELELKNQILQGDTDVLTYDLVTCRDSLRILNSK